MPASNESRLRSPSTEAEPEQNVPSVAVFDDVPLEPYNRRPSRRTSAGPHLSKWSLGILNDKRTEEVPGTVLLLTSKNEPLGMNRESFREGRDSSMPSQA